MAVWEVIATALIVVALSMIVVFTVHCIHSEIRIRRNERLGQEQVVSLPLSLPAPIMSLPAPISTQPPPGCAVVRGPDNNLSLAWSV